MLRTVSSAALSQDAEEMKLEILREMLYQQRVVGIWSDTIVPSARDFARWAGGLIKRADVPRLLTSSVGDIAIAGLATIQPEIGLVLKGLQQVVKQTQNQPQSQLI